jgi:hypothetical protein
MRERPVKGRVSGQKRLPEAATRPASRSAGAESPGLSWTAKFATTTVGDSMAGETVTTASEVLF